MAGSRMPSEGGERKADFSWGRGRSLPSLRAVSARHRSVGTVESSQALRSSQAAAQWLGNAVERAAMVGGLDYNQGFLCISWKPFLQMAACEKPSK